MKASIIASAVLRCATPADLETVLAWLPDAASCRRWTGPAVRFPATADSLWEDIGADGQNTFGLCCAREETLLGFGQLLPRPGGVAHLARLMVAPHCRG